MSTPGGAGTSRSARARMLSKVAAATSAGQVPPGTAMPSNRLPAGARLPAERRLAAALGLSRTTVAAAYRLLRDEGYLASRQGSGSVTALPPGRLRRHASWVPVGSALARAAERQRLRLVPGPRFGTGANLE